jgi:hypothetical protein
MRAIRALGGAPASAKRGLRLPALLQNALPRGPLLDLEHISQTVDPHVSVVSRRLSMLIHLARTLGAVLPLALAAAAGSTPVAAQPSDSTIFAAFRWRNIGPANPGGRIVDIEAV